MKKILIFKVLAIFLLSQSVNSQSIGLSFPNGISACHGSVELAVEITNDLGSDIDFGSVSLDLMGTIGLSYTGNLAQSAGPVLVESIPGTPQFDFSTVLASGDVISFTVDLSLDCSGIPYSSTNLDLIFDFESGGVMMNSVESLSGFAVDSPDIDINTSSPIGVAGMIYYQLRFGEMTKTKHLIVID